jgi:hypothetical protein
MTLRNALHHIVLPFAVGLQANLRRTQAAEIPHCITQNRFKGGWVIPVPELPYLDSKTKRDYADHDAFACLYQM